jgi:hypothetical protein
MGAFLGLEAKIRKYYRRDDAVFDDSAGVVFIFVQRDNTRGAARNWLPQLAPLLTPVYIWLA